MSAFTLSRKRVFAVGVALVLGFTAYYGFSAEKPSDVFERYLSERRKFCSRYRLAQNEPSCHLINLKPADPLSTPEGRFAHSIQLPDPLKPDSGYRRGMTQDEYFNHLCKTEAGIFIYEKVKGVRGVLMMRPRKREPNVPNHLYAPEAPYFDVPDEAPTLPRKLLGPGRLEFLETRVKLPVPFDRERVHDSLLETQVVKNDQLFRYSGYDHKSIKTIHVESVPIALSKYGYTWRGVSRPHDRELGIGGQEIIVLELATNRVIAFLRGYVQFSTQEGMGQSGFQWTIRCPKPRKGAPYLESDFLIEALNPDLSN